MYHYYWYGFSYAKGSAEYASANNRGTKESEDCWQSVMDEHKEFVEAIEKLAWSEIFLEFFDVVHATIKYFIVNYLPQWFYFHWICWIIVYPFVLPVSVKLARRYNNKGCIRNHARPNINHKCIVNSFTN